MIVKKCLFYKGFRTSRLLKIVEFRLFRLVETPCFYDIETTGLSRYSTFLYLIGAVMQENNKWFLHQWMAEKEDEEPEILCEFLIF